MRCTLLLEPWEAVTAADKDAFEFFCGLSGRLEIAPASVHIRWKAFEDDGLRDVTEEEWSRVALRLRSLRLQSGESAGVEHRPKDGAAFTVRDLARAVEATEQETRKKSGSAATQHVYFEGLSGRDGSYAIRWGS